jgi:hypothetical protein
VRRNKRQSGRVLFQPPAPRRASSRKAEDASLRAAIRQHVRPAITRLRKQGVIEGISGGRGSKWKLAAI